MIGLRHRLWVGFGGLLFILLIVVTLSLAVLTHYSRALDQVFRENYDSAIYCDTMKSSLDALNNHAQRLLWGQPDVGKPSQIEADIDRFELNLSRQLHNCTLPGEYQLTAHLAELWVPYRVRFGQFDFGPMRDPSVYRQDLLPRYEELKAVAQQVADMNMRNMVAVDGQVKQTVSRVRKALLIMVAAAVVLTLLFIGAAGAAVLRPLVELTRSARQIEQGNLELSVPVRSRDEIGQLAEAFNSMARELRQARRLDAEQLARTLQTTQLAIDSLPDPVFLIGPGGTIEISNQWAREHLGIVHGKTIEDLGHGWLVELYSKILADPEPIPPDGYEAAIQIFDNGSEKFLLPRAVAIADGAGRTIGVTAILVDVTGLRHADEAKSDLVSTVSPELRTPLTALRMSILLMVEERFGALSLQQKKLMAAAAQESDRLYCIIENLLNLSRMESGRAQFQFSALSPGDIMSRAVDPLRAAFEQNGLHLETDIAPGLPDVLVDPDQIGYALTNLLTNALKFTPPPGTVRAAMSAQPGWLMMIVENSGPGIPAQFVPRLFDKFFRVPSESGAGGVGLGLAIAKRIVEQHGGQIEYHPRAAGGSVFRIILPAATNEHNVTGAPEKEISSQWK